MNTSIRFCCSAIALVAIMTSSLALAQDEKPSPEPDKMQEAKTAFVEGKKLFDAGELRKAALAFKKSYKLSKNPILLYNIGFTIDKMGKLDLAIFYYDKFLTDAPEKAPNRELATKRLAELQKQKAEDEAQAKEDAKAKAEAAAKAKSEATSKAEAEAETDTGGAEGSEDGFQHMIIQEAPPGKPIDITAFVPKGSGWTVTAYYRLPGNSEYTAVKTIKRYAELVARIPAKATSKQSLQYYVEASDGSEIVARSGEPTSPNLITIEESAKPRFYPDLEDTGGAWTSGPVGGAGGSGQTDARGKEFWYRWGTTGGAAAMVGLTAAFYLLSSDAASTLEGEAVASTTTDLCPDKPCRAYSKVQDDLQARGKRFETLGHITLGLGVATAAVAGYFWYKNLKGGSADDDDGGPDHYNPDNESPVSSVRVAPMVGETFVGGAATLEF